MRYYVKKGYFYYINKDSIFEITGDPCYLIGSHGHDEHHKMEKRNKSHSH